MSILSAPSRTVDRGAAALESAPAVLAAPIDSEAIRRRARVVRRRGTPVDTLIADALDYLARRVDLYPGVATRGFLALDDVFNEKYEQFGYEDGYEAGWRAAQRRD